MMKSLRGFKERSDGERGYYTPEVMIYYPH